MAYTNEVMSVIGKAGCECDIWTCYIYITLYIMGCNGPGLLIGRDWWSQIHGKSLGIGMAGAYSVNTLLQRYAGCD